MVQLKQLENKVADKSDYDFNSNMVQLKQKVAPVQSQIANNFNSIMVQLKPLPFPLFVKFTVISIP